MQILACCDNSLTIPQYCKSLRMRCSIVLSTWHAFETDSTKMIAQRPRFDLETARMKFHTRDGLRKSPEIIHGLSSDSQTLNERKHGYFHPIHVAESKSCVAATLGAQTHFKTHTENDQRAVERTNQKAAEAGHWAGYASHHWFFCIKRRVTCHGVTQKPTQAPCLMLIQNRNCHDQFVLVHSLLTRRTERNGARTPTDREYDNRIHLWLQRSDPVPSDWIAGSRKFCFSARD